MDGFGFFSASQSRVVRPLPTLIPRCGACSYFRTCNTPKMRVDGRGERGILIVGERPGREEDKAGRPFVGKSGQLLAESLAKFGVDMRRDCWLTNAQICHDSLKQDKATVVDDCRPNLLNAVKELNPEVIILLGGDAVQSLIGHLWKSDCGGIGRWVGWQIPSHKPNSWICPTYNPAHVLRSEDKDPDPVLRMNFLGHLEAAVASSGRPHPDGPPDYARAVDVIQDVREAARRIRGFVRDGGTVAFDIETNMLKPDGPDAEIVCASVCWEGEETVAFPWHGEAIPAVRELLEDGSIGKVGWNAAFESRWVKRHLGITVRGWVWDGMLAAHALDPRGHISGLKFQCYVQLGAGNYNAHVEPFLESRAKGGNAPNRIREVKPSQLLLYCGMDSLLEFLVARKQMETINRE